MLHHFPFLLIYLLFADDRQHSCFLIEVLYAMIPCNLLGVMMQILASGVAIAVGVLVILFGIGIGAASISVGDIIELMVELCHLLH